MMMTAPNRHDPEARFVFVLKSLRRNRPTVLSPWDQIRFDELARARLFGSPRWLELLSSHADDFRDTLKCVLGDAATQAVEESDVIALAMKVHSEVKDMAHFTYHQAEMLPRAEEKAERMKQMIPQSRRAAYGVAWRHVLIDENEIESMAFDAVSQFLVNLALDLRDLGEVIE